MNFNKFISGTIFILPGRKYPRLVFDNYLYNVHKSYGSKTRWRCMFENKTKCTAVLHTYGNYVVARKSHNHAPYPLDHTQTTTPREVKVIRHVD